MPSIHKYLLLIVAALCCVICVYLNFFRNGYINMAEDQLEKINVLEAENKHLLQENKRLQEKILSLSNNKNELDEPVANEQALNKNHKTLNAQQPLSSVARNTNKPYQAGNLVSYQAVKKSDDFHRWLLDSFNRKNGFNLADEMQSRFDAEKSEPVWAREQEQLIRNQFVTNAALEGAALKDVKCHSMQCQIVINITDLDQANLWLNQTTTALDLLRNQKIIIATPDVQKNITTLYVDIGGEGFNFQ